MPGPTALTRVGLVLALLFLVSAVPSLLLVSLYGFGQCDPPFRGVLLRFLGPAMGAAFLIRGVAALVAGIAGGVPGRAAFRWFWRALAVVVGWLILLSIACEPVTT